MKINQELIGKEVIDASGNHMGVVKDVEWDLSSKKVIALELQEAGITAKIGLGDNKIIPIDIVKEVGDTVLIKDPLSK